MSLFIHAVFRKKERPELRTVRIKSTGQKAMHQFMFYFTYNERHQFNN